VIPAYAANVHPSESFEDVMDMLNTKAAYIRTLAFPEEDLPIELRFGLQAINELKEIGNRQYLKETLSKNRLKLATINAFPIGEFYTAPIKDNVYKPTWGEQERTDATLTIADLYADMIHEGEVGVISTSPGGYKPWGAISTQTYRFLNSLAAVLIHLHTLHQKTGRCIRLSLEPEPSALLENTDEVIRFFESPLMTVTSPLIQKHGFSAKDAERIIKDYLGITIDACHLAVQFENPIAVLTKLEQAKIRVDKLHVSAAVSIKDPLNNKEGMNTLRAMDEPKYLHQTAPLKRISLSPPTIFNDLPDFFEALDQEQILLKDIAEIRSHFHIPLHITPANGLNTTIMITKTLLHECVKRNIPVVNETYMWSLFTESQDEILAGIADELLWTFTHSK